uniref:Uncharacterized protein n=1 Tax=Rhizoctonia cerealis phyllomonavirus TaxID=3068671 RepID=A0AA51BSC7_9MONO|nr:MAG: hypothetical protein [Rhizoctonia cerealis phyllomonavirus]
MESIVRFILFHFDTESPEWTVLQTDVAHWCQQANPMFPQNMEGILLGPWASVCSDATALMVCPSGIPSVLKLLAIAIHEITISQSLVELGGTQTAIMISLCLDVWVQDLKSMQKIWFDELLSYNGLFPMNRSMPIHVLKYMIRCKIESQPELDIDIGYNVVDASEMLTMYCVGSYIITPTPLDILKVYSLFT